MFPLSKIHTAFGPNCLYVLNIIPFLPARLFFPSCLERPCAFIPGPGSCVVRGHSRTNVLDPLLIVAFWVPDKISDGSRPSLLPSYVRCWRIDGVTTTPSVRFCQGRHDQCQRVSRRRNTCSVSRSLVARVHSCSCSTSTTLLWLSLAS